MVLFCKTIYTRDHQESTCFFLLFWQQGGSNRYNLMCNCPLLSRPNKIILFLFKLLIQQFTLAGLEELHVHILIMIGQVYIGQAQPGQEHDHKQGQEKGNFVQSAEEV